MNEFLIGIINTFHGWFGNYIFALILFTVLMKAILLPLDFMQRKSMQKQLELNPKMEALKAKYGKDPQKLQQKQMELYKTEKFNPFAGCLPLLIQLPVLWIVFGAIRLLSEGQIVMMFDTVERTGHFVPEGFLWIRNIWQPDNIVAPVIPPLSIIKAFRANNSLDMFVAGNETMRLLGSEHLSYVAANYERVMAPVIAEFSKFMNGYAILPVLSAGVSFLSTKMMPKQPEPTPSADGKPSNANMMKYMNYFMPVMMAYFCWSSSAAFAIYWVVTSILEVLKQLLFRVIYPDPNKAQKKGAPTVID